MQPILDVWVLREVLERPELGRAKLQERQVDKDQLSCYSGAEGARTGSKRGTYTLLS